MNCDVCEHFNPIDLPCDRCGKVTRDGDVHTCAPRRLTDDQIGRIWFAAKIPGLIETDARRLIRAAEEVLRQ
jgi:hypothetical protein